MQPRIAVIIPVFNEQANVKKCIRTMLKYTQTISQQIRIIFVNDGSSDNTGLLLKEAAKYNPGKILICTHTKNQGMEQRCEPVFRRQERRSALSVFSWIQT
jgi:glycosyltransferase involved in cell wall biosynthesis